MELEHAEGTVTITREKDTMIPHIYADNYKGTIYGQGFANAQSRLWNMEKMRRAARGKLSEVFGDSQLKHDTMMRSMKLTSTSIETVATLSQEV